MSLRRRALAAAGAATAGAALAGAALLPAKQPEADLSEGASQDVESLPGASLGDDSGAAVGTAGQGPTSSTTTVAVTSTTSTTTVAPFVMPEDEPTPPDDPYGNDAYRARILACIGQYEGDYGTETGNGHSGRYQFIPSTWAYSVTGAGYPQYANRPASEAPPHVQDAAAWWLYEREGFGPWPPAMRYCRG